MQLSVFTDLALRIVMRLAVLDAEQSVTTSSLADQLRVRYSHATKVVAALHKMGIVGTRRGRSGGLWLTDEGKKVSVGAIVRELEGDREVVDCDGANPCPLRGACRLRWALRDAKEAFFSALDPIYISALASPPTQSLLLSLAPPTPRP